MKEIETIDIAPTWISVLNMVKLGILDVKNADLEKPCNIFDTIIKEQKNGAKSVTFNFHEDGTVVITRDRS